MERSPQGTATGSCLPCVINSTIKDRILYTTFGTIACFMLSAGMVLLLLPTTQLPALLDILSRELPRSFKVHGELKNHLLGKWPGMSYWVDAWPDPKVVFSKPLPGLTKSTYLDNIVSLYSWDGEALTTMLKHPGFVDWSQKPVFAAVDERWRNIVEAEGKKNGCILEDGEEDVYVYMATESSLKSYEVPPGLTLMSMKEEHVPMLVQKWRYSRPGVETYMQALISAFPSRCLLDSTGRMSLLKYNSGTHILVRIIHQQVGCILGLPFGTMGMLMVDEDWRRKGLASLLLTSQARQYPQPPSPSLMPATSQPSNYMRRWASSGQTSLSGG